MLSSSGYCLLNLKEGVSTACAATWSAQCQCIESVWLAQSVQFVFSMWLAQCDECYVVSSASALYAKYVVS